MTKQELDKWFSESYQSIELTAKKIIRKSQKKVEHLGLISEAYLNLVKNREKIEDKNGMLWYTVRFIFTEVNWSGSKTSKQGALIVDALKCVELREDMHGDGMDLLKIDLETFINTPENMVNGHILTMTMKGHDTKSISKELKVSGSTGKRLVRDMRTSLKRLVNN